MVYEVAKSLSHENARHRDQLSPEMTTMIDAGLAVSPAQYDAARELARTCRAMLPKVFAEADVLLAPSTQGEAPAGIVATGDPLFNRIWTLLHVPVVHVPAGTGPRRMPLGLTVVGPLAADRATLRAADWIHARLGSGETTGTGKG
jgi:amidase